MGNLRLYLRKTRGGGGLETLIMTTLIMSLIVINCHYSTSDLPNKKVYRVLAICKIKKYIHNNSN